MEGWLLFIQLQVFPGTILILLLIFALEFMNFLPFIFSPHQLSLE
jgi:hypothetical protein